MSSPRPCSALLSMSMLLAAANAAAAPLDFVPSESPYLLARTTLNAGASTTADLDQSLTLLLLPWLSEAMRDGYCDLLSCVDANLTGEANASAMPMPAGMRKLFDELAKLARPEQWSLLGLKLDGEMALYGLGALPVLRIELDDEAAFRAFVAALAEGNGAPLRELAVDDGTAWMLGSPTSDGQYSTGPTIPALLLAVQDGAMVATFVAEAASDGQIIAQLARPAGALGRSGLKSMAQKYGLDGRLLGRVDLQKLATQLLSPSDPTDRAFRTAHGMDAAPLEPLCASEALALTARVPRVVFGLASGSAQQLNSRWIVELEASLAGELSRASRRGPQLLDQGHAIDASFALEIAQLLSTLRTRAEQGLAAPFLCEQFADSNASMQQLLGWTTEAMATPWNGLVSARVEFPSVTIFDFNGFASSMEARDPVALLQTLNWAFPSLAEMQLSADGKFFVLQDGEGSNRVLANVSGTRINAAVGAAAEQRLSEIAAAPQVADAPAVSLRFDRALWHGNGWISDAELKELGPLAQRVRGVLLESRLTTRGVESLLRLELSANP